MMTYKVGDELYTGIKEIVIANDEELAAFYQTMKIGEKLLINEYLIIKDKDEKVIDKFRMSQNGLVKLRYDRIKGLKPLNAEQECAIDLLSNKDIKIKCIIGNYGSGKTFLNLRYGIFYVKEKEFFKQILYIRHNVNSAGMEPIGYLPGDKWDKFRDYTKAISDNLEKGEEELETLMKFDHFRFEIPQFIKGQTWNDAWVLCDECEDYNIKQLKLIGTRVGEKSCIVLSGDYEQTEKKFQKENGLLTMIEAFKGNPLFGLVTLKEDVRSEVSKLFATL